MTIRLSDIYTNSNRFSISDVVLSLKFQKIKFVHFSSEIDLSIKNEVYIIQLVLSVNFSSFWPSNIDVEVLKVSQTTEANTEWKTLIKLSVN